MQNAFPNGALQEGALGLTLVGVFWYASAVAAVLHGLWRLSSSLLLLELVEVFGILCYLWDAFGRWVGSD